VISSFFLLRLADTTGGIDKVKYYICQNNLLLDVSINNVEKKWSAPTCPADKILAASMRKFDKKTKELGNLKTED
jgi:hypothetical protein